MLAYVMSNCEFCHFPIGILGQMWYLMVSIPDLCTLTYFVSSADNLKRFANSQLDQDQDRQNVGPDLDKTVRYSNSIP